MNFSEGLVLREESDYRIGYLEEDFFKEHVVNAYIGCATTSGPPEFLHILNYLTEEMALVYFVTNREDFPDVADDEMFISDLSQGLDHALSRVYDRMGAEYIELFARDVHTFLCDNAFFFKETDDVYGETVRFFNQPVMSIW